MNSLSVGLVSLIQNASIYFEGSTDDTFETQLTVTDPTADRVLTLPNETGTILTDQANLADLADVHTASPGIGATLQWDNVNSRWGHGDPGHASTSTLAEGTKLYYTAPRVDARVDSHLNQSNPTSGYVLSWNGSDYAWVAQSGGGGGSATYILQENGDQILMEDSGAVLGDEVHQSVSTGAVSGTDLVLTMGDGKTVTIDATELKNVDTSVSISAPYWFQTYAYPGTGDATAGNQINTHTPILTTGPWHYGRQLAKGEEFLFDHTSSSQSYWLGIWGGSSTYDTALVGTGSYWTKSIRFGSTDVVSYSGSGTRTKGFNINSDYNVDQGATKFALVYDYSSSKLQLWERSRGTDADHRTLITTANDAEDGNPVTISAAYHVLGGDIPTFTAREHTWDIVANEGTPDDTTWFDGVEVNTVIRHGTGLHPGEKMTCVVPAGWAQQYFSWDYTGTSTGQLSIVQQLSTSWRATSQEYLMEQDGYTINPYATRYDTSVQTVNGMGGAKISVRYHIDNSLDVFDEDNEEVLFTKDADMDGNPAYMYIGYTGGASSNMMFTDWTFEPFAPGWYFHPASKYKPNKKFNGEDLDGNNTGRLTWGEKMYPGQELIFQESMGGSGNTHMGVRLGDDTAWVKSVSFDGTYLRNQATGFDIDGGTSYGVNNKWIALRYDYGDKKLKWYDINTTGVETLITTANVAEDGNAIRITCAGNNKVPNAPTLRYYGWEYAHTRTESPQAWNNWRIDRPSVNDTIKNDTVMRHIRGLLPGQYMRWTTAESGLSIFFGGWKSANVASGLTNIDVGMTYWDWGFRMNNSERVVDLHNMTFNTANTDYSSPHWNDPDKGTTQIQIRYHASNNKIDLHDHTNNRIIATKDAAGDGNAIYLGVGLGNSTQDLPDNFLGGGDVEIAASTFAPTFTTALNMGYDNDGVLNVGEMVQLDATVPVGKRLILTPEFFGYNHDQNGIADSGPAVPITNTLASAVAVDDTTITLTDASDFASRILNGKIRIAADGTNAAENFTVTGRSGNVLTVAAATIAHLSGATVTMPTGWEESDLLHFGWQKANSPFVGTNIGNSNSGWDAGVRHEMRGAGAGHAARIGIYSPGNATFDARDSRSNIGLYTFLYFTLDRISTSSGRIMAFTTLAGARAGIGGDNTQFYATDNNYMDGGADTLTLTSDLHVYVYAQAGHFTLPTVECTELITIPT